VLFDDSVAGNPFVPPGLDPAYARFLQENAHQAVTSGRHDVGTRAKESHQPGSQIPVLKP